LSSRAQRGIPLSFYSGGREFATGTLVFDKS
jgi:hypothetical protein